MRRDDGGIVQTIGRTGNGEGNPHTPHETLLEGKINTTVRQTDKMLRNIENFKNRHWFPGSQEKK